MNIINNIGLISVFLLILLSVFLFVNNSKNKTANTFFALFLLTTSFGMSALFLHDFYADHVGFNHLRSSAVFLQIPLFYFYIKKACFHDFNLQWKHLTHVIPFIISSILFLTVGITDQIDLWYAITSQLQYYLYIAAVFHILFRYRKIHNENHALQNKAYSWLMTTTVLFVISNTIVLFRGVFVAFNDYQSFPLLNLSISLFGLGIISWFVLKTMRHPEIFTSVYQSSEVSTKIVPNQQPNYEEEITRITAYMQEHKPYLEEAITLQSLAKKITIPEKHLSFLINNVMEQHFFDFINKYRIVEAKELLLQEDLNIQQIMFKVGFNSKSSFNTAFKKYTSSTPSDYRKSHQ